MAAFLRFTQFIQKTFALWVIVFAALALWQPEFFVWLKAYIPWILGIIMLGMGMTMTVDDFKGVLQSPKAVLIGVVAQFVVMLTWHMFYVNYLIYRLKLRLGSFWWVVAQGNGFKCDYLYGQRQCGVIGSLHIGINTFSTCINPCDFLSACQPMAKD